MNGTAQVQPSGMTAGGMARMNRLINEFGYKPLGFVDTRYGQVFLAEKMVWPDPEGHGLYAPCWKVLWGARDAAQELDCPLSMSAAVRKQNAIDAAIGHLKDRNDVYEEV